MNFLKYVVPSAILLCTACAQHPAAEAYSSENCLNRYASSGSSYDYDLLNRYYLTGERARLDSFLTLWKNEARASVADTVIPNDDQRLGMYFIKRFTEEYFTSTGKYYPYYVYDGKAALEKADTLYPVMQDSLESEVLHEDTIHYRLDSLPKSVKPLLLDKRRGKIIRAFLCAGSKEETLKKFRCLDSLFYVYPDPDQPNAWFLKSPPSKIKIVLTTGGNQARVFYSRGFRTGGWLSYNRSGETWVETEHVVWSE